MPSDTSESPKACHCHFNHWRYCHSCCPIPESTSPHLEHKSSFLRVGHISFRKSLSASGTSEAFFLAPSHFIDLKYESRAASNDPLTTARSFSRMAYLWLLPEDFSHNSMEEGEGKSVKERLLLCRLHIYALFAVHLLMFLHADETSLQKSPLFFLFSRPVSSLWWRFFASMKTKIFDPRCRLT